MNVLVTGGAGFVGSHVVDAYVRAGHRVVVVDDLSAGRAEQVNPAAVLVRMDVRDPGLEEVLRAHDIAAINHHAARIDVRASVVDPRTDAEVNVLGTLQVLEAARRSGVARVLFASSGGAVYGEQEAFPATEAHPTRPLSPYGAGKLCAEVYCGVYARTFGLRVTVLRYANVYGPRQQPRGDAGVVAVFCDRMRRGEPVTVHGDGRQTRDFVHVEDVAALNTLALEGPAPQDGALTTLHVASGVETDVATLHHLLAARFGDGRPPVHGPAKAGEPRRSVLDAARAAATLGWTPRIELADGLAATVDWFRAQG